jgi:hypothetical protein
VAAAYGCALRCPFFGMHAMKLPRRRFLHLAAGAAALPTVSRIARAQIYPTRQVHILVGFPPAGSTDITARLIGQWLSMRLGQQFVIENRPGAGATLATEAVVRAPADGYTLLLTGSIDVWNTALYGNLRYNYGRCLRPRNGCSRCAPVCSLEVCPRVNCLRQGQSRQDSRGLVWRRHRATYLLGTFQA